MKAWDIRFWGLLAAGITLCAALGEQADAAPRICRQLEAELAGGAAKSPARKYDAAIIRQREQMAIARAQARDAGCGFALSGRTVRQCAVINAALQRMAGNLETLQRQRGRLAGGKRPRAALLAALDANGCRARDSREDERRTARAAWDKVQSRRERDMPAPASDETAEAFALRSGPDERFRTVCVRVCDGYFFPMSQASSTGDFDRDGRNCRSSCPGAEMQLFYGPPETEGAADMLSTSTGRPYSALPTAFQHQKMSAPRPAGCGCGKTKKAFEVVAGTAEDLPSAGTLPSTGIPAAARVPADAAEPASGGSSAAWAAAAPSASIVEIPLPPDAMLPAEKTAPPNLPVPVAERPLGDRKVRVVGPAFLPDPEAAEDRRVPAPPPAR